MRSFRARRRLPVTIVLAFLVMSALTGAAAPPPPGNMRPTRCLEEFTANDDYVGDGWPAAPVATARDARLGRDVRLLCGDELSGVVHVAHPESTGTVHPVTAADEGALLGCFRAVITQGESEPDEASEGRT